MTSRQKDRELVNAPPKQGYRSVLDIGLISGQEPFPFDLDVGRYLDEALIGIRGAPDNSLRLLSATGGERKMTLRSEPQRKERGQSLDATDHWFRLKGVLQTEPARVCCEVLFWISLAVIFCRVPGVPASAVDTMRETFSQNWHLVVLEVGRRAPRQAGVDSGRDRLLEVLPVVFVQVLFRLLVDSFDSDQPVFVQQGDPLIDKLARVVYHEVVGFRLNPETCRKDRQRFLQKKVIRMPHSNLFEAKKNEERRQFLEQQSKLNGPLDFGRLNGNPLEEVQLEHVMYGREQDKLSKENPKQAAAIGKKEAERPRPKRPPPEKLEPLSVDRYALLVQEGNDMFTRQLKELGIDESDSDSSETDGVLGNLSPQSRSLGSTMMSAPGSPNLGSPQSGGRASPMLSDSRGLSLGTTLRMSHLAAQSKVQRRKREREREDRVRREEQVTELINSEILPAILCERGVDTAWVSPAVDLLAPAERSRQALRKRAAESYRVKMRPPRLQVQQRLPSLTTSASAPAIASPALTTAVAAKGAAGPTSPMSPGSPGPDSPYSTASSPAPPGRPHRRNSRQGLAKAMKGETFNPDAPFSVKSAVTTQRLEEQRQVYLSQSFGSYMQDFDIKTGIRKQPLDPEALRAEEAAFLAKAHALIGSRSTPALRFLRPAERTKAPAEIGSHAEDASDCGERSSWNILTVV